MILARVDGHAVISLGHASLKGQSIALCTPINEHGASAGEPFAAINSMGAGLHARVFITTDGSWTQDALRDLKSPIRNQIMGLLD